jgi:hypothetical protein
MLPYRKQVKLPTGSDYWFVHMGAIPNRPEWHSKMYESSSFAFPTEKAANLFASNHQTMYPNRLIEVKRGK